MNYRRFIGPVAGILVSLVLLWLALSRVPISDIGTALRSADYRLILFSGVFTFLSYIFRTARWARFLQPQKKIPLPRLYPILIIGFALNNFIPGRPGELARAFALGQREGLPKTLGLATVIVERVADGLTLIAVLALLSLAFTLPGWGQQVEVISIAIFVIALGGLLFLLWREQLATRILNRLIRFLPERIGQRLTQMLGSFILGLHSLRSPRDVLAIALFSFGAWMCEATHYFVILTAFGLLGDVGMRAIAAAFMMVMVNLAISVPISQSGLGLFEGAGTLALGAFGVPGGPALSAVLVAHAVQFILISSLGIGFIAHEGLKWGQAVEPVEGN